MSKTEVSYLDNPGDLSLTIDDNHLGLTVDANQDNISHIIFQQSQIVIPQKQEGLWNVESNAKNVIVSFDERYTNVREIEWCPWYYRASAWWREGILHVIDNKTEVHLWFEYAWINQPDEFWIHIAMKDKKLVFLQNKDGVPLEVEGLQYDDRLRNLWNNASLYEDKKWYAIVEHSEKWVEEIFRAAKIEIIEKNNVTAALDSESSLILFAYNQSWRMAIITHSENGVKQLSEFIYYDIWYPNDASVMSFIKEGKGWKVRGFLSIYSDGIHETNPGIVASSSRIHNSEQILYKVWLFMIWSKTKKQILEDGKYNTVIPFPEEKKED